VGGPPNFFFGGMLHTRKWPPQTRGGDRYRVLSGLDHERPTQWFCRPILPRIHSYSELFLVLARSCDDHNPAAGQKTGRPILSSMCRDWDAYFASKPDPDDPLQRVAFAPRGLGGSFVKNSSMKIYPGDTQAICDHRRANSLPAVFIGIDTNALAEGRRLPAPSRCLPPTA